MVVKERAEPPADATAVESEQLATALETWVGGESGRAARVVHLRRLSGGLSREAWAVDLELAEPGFDGRRRLECVLLRSAPISVLETSRSDEFDLLRTLAGTPVPAPEVFWLDADGSVLDRPAFLMSRAPGSADRWRLRQMPEDVQREVDDQFVETLVQLHGLDVSQLETGRVRVPSPDDVARIQVEHWFRVVGEVGRASLPAFSELFSWLLANAPRAERLSIVHGDYRYGNFLFEGAHLTAVLDWEMAHIGDPVEDVVWPFRPFRAGSEPLLPYAEFIARYARSSGYELAPVTLAFYRVLGEVKSAAIWLTGVRAFLGSREPDVNTLVPAHLIACSLRQALIWIDEWEGTC